MFTRITIFLFVVVVFFFCKASASVSTYCGVQGYQEQSQQGGVFGYFLWDRQGLVYLY